MLLLPTVASAEPIADCYTSAVTANPGLEMTVTQGTNTFVTSNPNAFMTAVAKLHGNPSMSVSYNSAGKAAVQESMQCIWDAKMLTLSSVWLNQNVTDLQLKATTAQRISGSVTHTLSLDGKGMVCSSGDPGLELSGDGDTATIPAAKYGPYDLKVVVATGLSLVVCADVTLECGNCLGECDDDYSICFCGDDDASGDDACSNFGGVITIGGGKPLITLNG